MCCYIIVRQYDCFGYDSIVCAPLLNYSFIEDVVSDVLVRDRINDFITIMKTNKDFLVKREVMTVLQHIVTGEYIFRLLFVLLYHTPALRKRPYVQ